MLDKTIIEKYNRWLSKATNDPDLIPELKNMSEKEINDVFYSDLKFGTGGLRGVIGAGTNKLNIYTIAKATQGLANYIIANFSEEERRVAISRDTRIKSDLFMEVTARVLAANGIKCFLYPYVCPVPCLSYATRYLKCCNGVMITASHNPSKYNGYKVYGKDGCQITTEAAEDILSYISEIDVFDGYRIIDFNEGVEKGLINYIEPEVLTNYIEEVKKQSFLGDEKVDKTIKIVYSPLNGSGLYPVTRTLKEQGFTNIIVVNEQEQPDGNFPTCPFPNPEIREALNLGLQYCKKYNADLMLATDPDCDRVGIAVKDKNGEYQLLSGNEVGILLLDYICSRRLALGTIPKDPVMCKTIATMDLGKVIAEHYGLRTIDVLTGFKFIGEQIGFLEKQGKEDSYVFGFEDSYGYLSGTYVRDKDGVNGACLICEMFAYYQNKGLSLLEKLDDLWNQYGYCLNTLHFYEFDGQEGEQKINSLMEVFRKGLNDLAGIKTKTIIDYLPGINGLPKSNVLKYMLEGNCSVVFRPSGTEPKIKLYLSISAKTKELAEENETRVIKYLESFIL